MNREWDRGKESWGSEGNGAAHDDDYYGDNKRRKFNTGGYEAQNYDPATYSHKQAAGAANPSFAGGGKKRLQASEPSPHVIFLGLDPDFTEADLQNFLSNHGCAIETVTIIRERASGASKGFGFAQFPTTEHARAFVDPLFPFIQMPPPASHGATAMQQYYKALETGLPHNGRRVKIDYSQSASPNDKGRATRGNTNDGTRDIGNSQHAVLLFRGLDPLSGPQAIHQAMRSSAGPGKEGAKGMKRIVLIKDRVTLASFGFAFVEFVDIPSAAATFGATMSPQIHPSGFRISDKPVAVSFAHPDSFQSVDPMLRDEASIQSSLGLGGVDGGWVRYWDEASTIAVLEFRDAKSVQPEQAAPTKEKKEKKKKEAAVAVKSAVPAPSALPVSDKPVTLSFNKGLTKNTAALKPVVLGFSAEDGSEGDEGDNDNHDGKFAAKRVAPLINSKKTASNISKWNQVQEELSGTQPSHAASGPSSLVSGPSQPQPSFTPAVPSEPTSSTGDEFEFSDVKGMSCLLCSRQFKALEQLKRHNKESDLHKKNLKDTNLREVAKQKVLAKRSGNTGTAEQPKYRDRASERRILFNQPDVPLPEKEIDNGGPAKGKKRPAEAVPPPPPPPVPALNLGKDESNVGNKLLKMMGWQEGTGLGTAGDGIVDPIKTSVYAEGAGLGASKGKELEKYAEGFSSYVSMAQQAARDRFSP